MRTRAVLLTLAVAFGAGAVGCAPTGQGDPCTPEAIPTGGFSNMEVYVETSSVQCRTRVCMVYRLTGNPECPAGTPACLHNAACMPPNPACIEDDNPALVQTGANSPDRVFCTCRCSAGGNSSLPLCRCVDGFYCIPDNDPGGGYCVPAELARAANVCYGPSDCSAPQTCDSTTHHCH